MSKFIYPVLISVFLGLDALGVEPGTLQIRVTDAASPVPTLLTMAGKKLSGKPLTVTKFSEDFSIENLDTPEGRLSDLLKDPLEAYLVYCRLLKDGYSKQVQDTLLLLDDKDADLGAVTFLKEPATMRRMVDYWRKDLSIIPLFLIRQNEDIVDIFVRVVSADESQPFNNPDVIRMKKDGEKWKMLPFVVSESNPSTLSSFKILDALGKNLELVVDEVSE